MKHKPVVIPMYDSDELVALIHQKTHFETGKLTSHQFPDGETVIRIDSDIADRTVILVTSLNQPDTKVLPLLFAANTARSLGASAVVLVAPYLAYMRQDKVFEPGQGITSEYFAGILSRHFDRLITIDPHLHRWHTLGAIYSIPTHVLHATHPIAHWIVRHVHNPLLIGPDSESVQWVRDIAENAQVPYLVLEKIRKGDTLISVSIPRVEKHSDAIPILVDDIVSTGMTMIATIAHLKARQMHLPVCIGVHGVFSANAFENLFAAGAGQVITCNTIPHVSNEIDISDGIAECLTGLFCNSPSE